MRKFYLIPTVLAVLMFSFLLCQPITEILVDEGKASIGLIKKAAADELGGRDFFLIAQDTKKGKSFNHADLSLLKGPFNSAKEVTAKCITCHKKEAEDFIETVHWKWMGPSPNFEGHERETNNGKVNLINNFCVAIESNWARCTQCHAGYGWEDRNFDFSNTAGIDCLVCNDQSGKYKERPEDRGVACKRCRSCCFCKKCGRAHKGKLRRLSLLRRRRRQCEKRRHGYSTQKSQ